MKKIQKSLAIDQFDQKMMNLIKIEGFSPPSKGWINAIRTMLNMSLRQLGQKLGISAQSVKEIEQREIEDSITLKSLRETAEALGMKVIYVLIPKDGSLNNFVEKRANEKAREIVMRTSNTMTLEEQGNSDARIEKSIREKTEEIKKTLPKYLWD